MVYDEAIEFGMGDKNTSNYSNFLVFMNYSPNDGKTQPANDTVNTGLGNKEKRKRETRHRHLNSSQLFFNCN